jgi:hypothetical protein
MKNYLPLLAVLVAGHAHANVVIFSDTFSRVEGKGDGNTPNSPSVTGGFSAWGTNDNSLGGTFTQTYIATNSAPRTGGQQQVVGTPYVGATQVTGIGSVGTLMSGSVKTGTSFTSAYNSITGATGLEISFVFDRFTDPAATAANGFLAIGFGTDTGALVAAGSATEAQDNSNWALLFQQAVANNGNSQTFTGSVTPVISNFEYGSAPSSPLDSHMVLITLIPSGSFNTANTSVAYTVNVDGTDRSSGTFLTNGADFGVITFSSNNAVQRYVDDLKVSAIVVPEPSISLLGMLSGLAFLRRRR